MGAVFVVDKNGKPLMPTYNKPKVRRMLKDGRAEIFCHEPFTIRLTQRAGGYTQPVHYDTDSGYQYAGVSVKSEKHEFLHMQADMLEDEKGRHDDRRKYRRTRRNRLRHRPPRFDNRRRGEGWIAPSLAHRLENQVRLFQMICGVCPITEAHIEVGRFDTQALDAVEKGLPLPEGTDYQRGPRYAFDTLREAVFARDQYTCRCCGASPLKKPGTILVIHHALYWKGDHTDRLPGLLTLCANCHTSANHQKGGKLWGLTPKAATANKAPAAFMNVVRWMMRDRFQADGVPTSITYGAATKRERLSRNIAKTHANDAYCIGEFRPKHRSLEIHIAKRRRNNRRLEKFRDATYIDARDGSIKSGKELSSGRTKRKEPRHGTKDLRRFRLRQLTKGCKAVRRKRYEIRPGDLVRAADGRVCTVNGTQNRGATLQLRTTKTVLLTALVPKTGKDKELLPVETGQKLALKGRKEKHEVLSVDLASGKAVMRWYMGVKPENVTRLTGTYGGWTVVPAQAVNTYKKGETGKRP